MAAPPRPDLVLPILALTLHSQLPITRRANQKIVLHGAPGESLPGRRRRLVVHVPNRGRILRHNPRGLSRIVHHHWGLKVKALLLCLCLCLCLCHHICKLAVEETVGLTYAAAVAQDGIEGVAVVVMVMAGLGAMDGHGGRRWWELAVLEAAARRVGDPGEE